MAAGLNVVNLIGRLTADPILKKTTSNLPVVSFTVAIDRRVGQGKEPAADFINCVAWNKTAENTAQYTHKGSLVAVEGRIQTRKYVDKQGNNRSITEVLAGLVYFLEPRGNSNQYQQQAQTTSAVETESDIPSVDISSDDLPF